MTINTRITTNSLVRRVKPYLKLYFYYQITSNDLIDKKNKNNAEVTQKTATIELYAAQLRRSV